ncbi:MAG: acyltransferase [Bacteroides sp.]|nr:acyltransferase [Prevotella sp.]MCM1408253.1 acyltransferase [Treponema brennaborense]MCM1469577.1 acyltransferase [Bacteroides sp.]
MRDELLDSLRGLVMIYIVCFIHVLYWLGFGNSVAKSFFLIEMPIVFFISGAAYKLSARKSFTAFIWSRIRRVVIPYFLWIALSLSAAFVLAKLTGSAAPQKSDAVNLLLLRGGSGKIPFNWHTWFIKPYLVIMLFAPLLQRILNSNPRRMVWGGVMLAGVFLLDVFRAKGMFVRAAQSVPQYLVYTLFFVCGFLYKEVRVNKRMLAFGSVSLALCLALIFSPYYTANMQTNKFPPNIVFTLYNIAVLIFGAALLGKIKIPKGTFVSIYNKRGYTIYLYQNWAYFLCSFALAQFTLETLPAKIAAFAFCVVFLFFLHLLISKIVEKIEGILYDSVRL